MQGGNYNMNQTIQELYERKSVRAYEERPIEPEKKEMVIQAAIQAPSAGNMTLYSIIDVTDQKLKDTLAVTCDNCIWRAWTSTAAGSSPRC